MTDKITLDIPLFIRLLEYAREDANTDLDLHFVSENAVEAMKKHEILGMSNYKDLIKTKTIKKEEKTKQPVNLNKLTEKYKVTNRKIIG